MSRADKLKILERLISGNAPATMKVVAYYQNIDGIIHREQLDNPIEVISINPDEWTEAVGVVYQQFGVFYFKSFIDEFKRWEGKVEAGIVELPIFFNLDLDVI
jgi:hypothetical protein